MYQPNDQYLQQPLFSRLGELPSKQRQKLEAFWLMRSTTDFLGGLMKTSLLCYNQKKPPVRNSPPVKVLFGLGAPEVNFAWSDEHMRDAFGYKMAGRHSFSRWIGNLVSQFELSLKLYAVGL